MRRSAPEPNVTPRCPKPQRRPEVRAHGLAFGKLEDSRASKDVEAEGVHRGWTSFEAAPRHLEDDVAPKVRNSPQHQHLALPAEQRVADDAAGAGRRRRAGPSDPRSAATSSRSAIRSWLPVSTKPAGSAGAAFANTVPRFMPRPANAPMVPSTADGAGDHVGRQPLAGIATDHDQPAALALGEARDRPSHGCAAPRLTCRAASRKSPRRHGRRHCPSPRSARRRARRRDNPRHCRRCAARRRTCRVRPRRRHRHRR